MAATDLKVRNERLRKLGEVPRPLPRHVAICMDGNRRWAIQRQVPIQTAYYKAERVAEKVVESCQIFGIKAVTLFAFSEENWNRDAVEVEFLMSLMDWKIGTSWRNWKAKNLKLKFIGDFSRLKAQMRDRIVHVETETACNDGMILTIALSYGGRQDLEYAVRQIAEDVKNGLLEPGRVDMDSIRMKLRSQAAFREVGDPDLFIRTSGEKRLSNFMLWDLAYTELYFEQGLWPDFDEDKLLRAFSEYSKRERRFGT